MQDWDSINDGMCAEQKVVFEDVDDHGRKGGLKAMGDSMDRSVLSSKMGNTQNTLFSLDRGHVLVMSLWDDYSVNMLWLDSDYPPDR